MEHGHGSGHCCHAGSGHHELGGCCEHSGHGSRRYFTREEKAARLEKYLEQLRAEVAGVEEELGRLKSS